MTSYPHIIHIFAVKFVFSEMNLKEKQDNKSKSEEKFFKMHKDDSDRLFEENSAPIGWGYVIR